MKKFAFLFAMLFFAVFSALSFAQDESSQEEMNQAWMDYMTPGPMHRILYPNAGQWTANIKMWEDPAKPPTESTGTSEIKAILGGRYIEGTYTGSFNGMEMIGKEICGYDNAKKKFFLTWIDNFGTGIMYLEGTYDEGMKTFTYTGTSMDPMTNKDIPVREIIKTIDDDHQHMEMFISENGQEFKTMEIDYTRKK